MLASTKHHTFEANSFRANMDIAKKHKFLKLMKPGSIDANYCIAMPASISHFPLDFSSQQVRRVCFLPPFLVQVQRPHCQYWTKAVCAICVYTDLQKAKVTIFSSNRCG